MTSLAEGVPEISNKTKYNGERRLPEKIDVTAQNKMCMVP